MAYKDPDVENFRNLFAPQVEALRASTIPEQRASFDTTMEPIPLAPGSVAESLDLAGVAAEKITRKTLTGPDQQRLIDEALAEIDFSQLEASRS